MCTTDLHALAKGVVDIARSACMWVWVEAKHSFEILVAHIGVSVMAQLEGQGRVAV